MSQIATSVILLLYFTLVEPCSLCTYNPRSWLPQVYMSGVPRVAVFRTYRDYCRAV